MTEETTYFGKLKKNFPELLELIQQKGYVILEPKKKINI